MKTKQMKSQRETKDEEGSFPPWITQLAGGLVHELKNPLSTLKMNLQLLEEDLQEGENNRDKRATKKIRVAMEEISRLHNILDDFLRFTRSQKLEKSPHSLNQTLEEVLDFVEPEALHNNIKILRRLSPDLPDFLFDKNHLKQAILNLVLNAQQAMPEGGELIVETNQKGDFARMEFTDTGVGIPPDRLDKIWDVYFSSKKTGTGLGLPTTQKIIEAHKGKIEVQSEIDKGSKFTVLLPICLPSEE